MHDVVGCSEMNYILKEKLKNLLVPLFFFGLIIVGLVIIVIVGPTQSPYTHVNKPITISEKYKFDNIISGENLIIIDENENKYELDPYTKNLFHDLRLNHRYIVNLSVPRHDDEESNYTYEHSLRFWNGTIINQIISEVPAGSSE